MLTLRWYSYGKFQIMSDQWFHNFFIGAFQEVSSIAGEVLEHLPSLAKLLRIDPWFTPFIGYNLLMIYFFFKLIGHEESTKKHLEEKVSPEDSEDLNSFQQIFYNIRNWFHRHAHVDDFKYIPLAEIYAKVALAGLRFISAWLRLTWLIETQAFSIALQLTLATLIYTWKRLLPQQENLARKKLPSLLDIIKPKNMLEITLSILFNFFALEGIMDYMAVLASTTLLPPAMATALTYFIYTAFAFITFELIVSTLERNAASSPSKDETDKPTPTSNLFYLSLSVIYNTLESIIAMAGIYIQSQSRLPIPSWPSIYTKPAVSISLAAITGYHIFTPRENAQKVEAWVNVHKKQPQSS